MARIPFTAPIQFDFAGYRRPYILHKPNVPGGYSPSKGPFPLVFFFHGNGGSALGMEQQTDWDTVADSYPGGFYACFPQGRGTQWDADGTPYDDVNYIMAVLGNIEAGFPINRQKIIVAGYSEGAGFAQSMVIRNQRVFSGLALVAYNLQVNSWPNLQACLPMPTWLCHGTADPVIPYAGGQAHSGAIVYSTAQSAELLAQWNGCSDGSETITTDTNGTLNDGTSGHTNTITTWANGTSGWGVQELVCGDAGHTIPGSNQKPTAVVQGQPSNIGYVCTSEDAPSLIANFLLPYSNPYRT